jgi:uncharacterized membrane protein HdeD (DUF308 family)
MKTPTRRIEIIVSLLRGVLILVAGLLALVFPPEALRVVAVVGGCLLIVDSILGALASQNYGVEASWPFWLALVRGVLVFVAGVAVLFSPVLASIMAPAVLANCIGVGAIAIGLIELFILLRYRKDFPPIWTTLAGALLYVALGAALLLLPLSGVLVIMQIGGGLLVVFGIIQVIRAWKASTTVLGGAGGLR